MRGDEPVDRLALGRHGAPFRGGNAGGDFGELFEIHIGQPVGSETQRADQARDAR